MKYPPVQYHDYLKLDQLLSSQKRRSEEFGKPAHDEWLFITVHQTYELWFQQILCELKLVTSIFCLDPIPEVKMGQAQHHLHRIVSILRLILGQIDVLETMTPLDFLEFRDTLYPASGFQSFQFRLLETQLGLRSGDRLQLTQAPFYSHLKPEQQQQIIQALDSPNLHDLIEGWLERTPLLEHEHFSFWRAYQTQVMSLLSNDEETIRTNPRLSEEDRKRSYAALEQTRLQFSALLDEKTYQEMRVQGQFRLSQKAFMAALLIQLYREEPIFQIPFQILSGLLDIDELLTQWRYRHSLMAHRMLGSKIGTGGSSGHQYLKDATEKHKIFTDFFNLTTFLIPRSQRPALPAHLQSQLRFGTQI